jgi:hypothetical protein
VVQIDSVDINLGSGKNFPINHPFYPLPINFGANHWNVKIAIELFSFSWKLFIVPSKVEKLRSGATSINLYFVE